jgi:bacterial/archaeal transporter family protein
MAKSYTFAIFAMMLWGIAPIFGKLGLTQLEPLSALTLRSSIITLILLIFVTVGGHWSGIVSASSRDMFFVGMEGLCAALLGQLAYYYALKYGEVSKVSPVVAAFPLVALMLAFVIFGEKITLWNVMGSVFIVVGIFLLKY